MSNPNSKKDYRELVWWVKWSASITILISLAMRAAGPEYRMWDLLIGEFGIGLWLWVSVMWKDRALIILNAVSFFMLLTTILKEI